MTITAAPSEQGATPTPESQIQQYYATRDAATTPPPPAGASTTTAAPVAPTDQPPPPAEPSSSAPADYWSEIADDDDLPPSMKGKTRREVWDAMKPTLATNHQLGFQKNRLEADLTVERALNAALQREMQARTAAQPRVAPHERVGLQDPSQAIIDPNVYGQNVNQLINYVDQQVAAAIDRVRADEVAPLRASVQQGQWERARDTAISSMKIDARTWAGIEKPVAAIMFAHGADPSIPQNWEIATKMYREGAPLLVPQPQRVEAQPLPVGQARPGASAGPAAAKKPSTTGNKHLDAAIDQHLSVHNDWRVRNGKPKMNRDEFVDFIGSDISTLAAARE